MISGRAWGLFATKGVVSIVLMAYLIQHVGISNLRTAFQGPSFSSVVASCILLTAYFVLGSIRWLIVLRTLGFNLPWRELLRITLVAQFFSQFLPSSLGADLLRMWQSSKSGLTAAVSISSVLLERITFFAGLSVLVCVLFTIRLSPYFPAPYFQILAAFAAMTVVAAGLLSVMDRLPASWMPRWMVGHVLRLSADSRSFYRTPGSLLSGAIVLVAGQAAFAATLIVLGPEFGIAINTADYLAIGPIIVLLGAIPISIAGWGIREAAMVGLLTHLGADSAKALQLSLAVGVLSIAASLPGAFIWVASKRVALETGRKA